MRRPGFIWLGISLLVVLGLLAGAFGCQQAAPATTAPAPAPKPTTTAPAPVPSPTTTAPAPKPTTTAPPAATTAPAAPTYQWKMSTAYSGTHIFMTAEREFIKAVEEGSKGQIKITLYEGGSLVPAAQEFDAVRSGQADFSFGSSAYHTGKVPEVNAISVTLERNPEIWKKAMLELQPLLNEAHNKAGVVYLYESSLHPYFLCSAKPIKTQADLKGKLVRVAGGLLTLQEIAIGGSPVTTAWAEIPEALQRGTVDAAWTSHRTYLTNKLERAAPYITWGKNMTNSDIRPFFNLKVWESLSPDLQEMIKKASYDVGVRGIDRITADVDEWVKEVKALGVTLIEMPDDWRLILRNTVRDEYLKNQGDQYKKIWAIIEKYVG